MTQHITRKGRRESEDGGEDGAINTKKARGEIGRGKALGENARTLCTECQRGVSVASLALLEAVAEAEARAACCEGRRQVGGT